jgi:hypothetical protein
MKNHNNLTDSQIHNPKGFSGARKRTVSSKNQTGGIEWVKANYSSSVSISCPADVGGQLHHSYFCLFSSHDAVKFAVYFQITNTAVLSTPSGYNQVLAINLTASGTGSTATQVANALQTTLNAHASFTATDDNAGTVTVTGLTTASPAVDVDAGVGIVITDTEITNEILHTNASGDLKFTPFSTILGDTGVNDKNFVHTQTESSATWTVTHNLGKNPSCTVVDSAGTTVFGQVDHLSVNQIRITFSGGFTGKAYFN